MDKEKTWAIITVTRPGVSKALEIQKCTKEKDFHIYTLKKYKTQGVYEVNSSLKDIINTVYKKYNTIIFIMATGIVIRMIAHLIESKTKDPAVLVVDDRGEYVISLLSGHIGGANENAKKLAAWIKGASVITTASDTGNKIAVDTFALSHGLAIENMKAAKDITAMIVNEEDVAIINNENINIKKEIIKDNLIVNDNEKCAEASGIIKISSARHINMNKPYVQLIPKNIIVGIGCRKGIHGKQIIGYINEKLEELNIHPYGIYSIATVEVKKEESGIIEASSYFNAHLKIILLDEISVYQDRFQSSSFVKKTIGVGSVCEPCGYIASQFGICLLSKTTKNGVALSIWKKHQEV